MSCCSTFLQPQLHTPGSSSSPSPSCIRLHNLAYRHSHGIRPPSTFFLSPALNYQQSTGARPRQRRRVFASAQVETETENTKSNSSTDGGDDDDSGSSKETGVVIIGGGLAGLAAARKLAMAGEPFLLLEASDGLGGRVRTDDVDGFLLDRGFQIFITAYPEAQQVLDYDALELQQFYAGAMVWYDGSFHRVADPLRHLADGLLSLLNPIGNVFDKILVGLVRLRAAARADDAILTDEESTILERLRKLGFSEAMVDRFFRPFFGGIFFGRDLQTTSRLFEFVFKCLATGSNTLPAAGIGAIPAQIAGALPHNAVKLNSRVTEIVFNEETGLPEAVKVDGGETVKCRNVVILAVEQPEARKLLERSKQKLLDSSGIGTKLPEAKKPRSTVCLYFEAEQDAIPVKEPVLLLNGSGAGIVNNMFFPTEVSRKYGPAGKGLVSVSLLGLHEGRSDEELVEVVKAELSSWFGQSVVDRWRHLRTYRVRFAQPDQTPPTDLRQEARLVPGVYVCGDHRHSSTFDGALLSGRFAAEALLNDLTRVRAQ